MIANAESRKQGEPVEVIRYRDEGTMGTRTDEVVRQTIGPVYVAQGMS